MCGFDSVYWKSPLVKSFDKSYLKFLKPIQPSQTPLAPLKGIFKCYKI